MYGTMKDKQALVMGAGKARGIGFHIAKALVRHGASVCLADSDAQVFDRAQELEAAGVFTADVRRDGEVARLRDGVAGVFPRLDVLVLCAGVFPEPAKLTEASVERWLRTQDINVNGSFRVLRALLPLMRERGGIRA